MSGPDPAGILASAKPGDMVVVAVLDPKGGAVIHTATPDARRLVNLASSLLDDAKALLAESEDFDDEMLVEDIEEALFALPDRHADPADAAEG